MIAQGIDGVSRGLMNEGVAAGSPMFVVCNIAFVSFRTSTEARNMGTDMARE
jgi:hypothetical protein